MFDSKKCDKEAKQEKLSFIASRNVTRDNHLEKQFGGFLKNKDTTIRSSNCAPWYFPQVVKNLCPHKNLHAVFYAI